MKCVVCRQENWRLKFIRQDTHFVECNNCGLVRMDPIPTDEIISEHYKKKFRYGNYLLIQEYDRDYLRIYKDFLAHTIAYTGEPKQQLLLDVGCFTGRFLDVAKQIGFATYGIEYQPEAAKIANDKHDGNIFCGTPESYTKITTTKFDVVTLFGVIEHVRTPDTTIESCAELLKTGGLLIIQTPNTNSLLARMTGSHWPAYAPVEHIHYFSCENIKLLLKRHGFNIKKIMRHWKHLPIGYIYNQFQNFGPEYYTLLTHVVNLPFFPMGIFNLKFPFYGGEMLIFSRKE